MFDLLEHIIGAGTTMWGGVIAVCFSNEPGRRGKTRTVNWVNPFAPFFTRNKANQEEEKQKFSHNQGAFEEEEFNPKQVQLFVSKAI